MTGSTIRVGLHCRRLTAKALLCLLPVLPMVQAWATSYSFTTSGTTPDGGYAATDVNNAGTVVGYQYDNSSSALTGFVYSAGVVTPVAGPAGAISADLSGITNSGRMVGNYSTTWEDDGTGYLFPGPSRIFSLANGVYSDIDVPGVALATVNGISSNGRWIVGNGSDDQGRTRGFAFDTSPGGVVTRFDGSATHVIAAGVNNLGVVVGYDRTSVSGVGTIGSAWTFDLASGQRSDFSVAGSQRTAAWDITDAGVISGYYYTSLRPAVAHGYTGLNGNFEFFDVPGASQTYVLGANDLGALVGRYLDAGGNEGAFLAVPVPEPAAAWLLVGGLAGLAAVRRRQTLPAVGA